MNQTGNQISVTETAKLLGVNNRTVHRRIIRGEFKLVTKFDGLRGPYILNRQEIESHVSINGGELN
jgi:IS30 family transposase